MQGDDGESIDAATMALCELVRDSSRHAALIQRIESGEPPAIDGAAPRVVVMPGAFHEHHAHTGADGRRVLELAAQLGWPAEVAPMPSLGSMTANAALLIEFLKRRRGRPIILVSLSKGGADVRAALDRPNAATELRDVQTWVNISGIVTGTPLVAWLRARPLRYWPVRLLLRLRGQPWAAIEELRHGPGAPLTRQLVLPSGMRAIHVAGFPRIRDLSNDWARRGHARLAGLGPNDGGGILLRDLLDLPGQLFPVRGADHYLNPAWDIRPLLLRILLEAARGAPDPDMHSQTQQHAADDVQDVMLLGGEGGVHYQRAPRQEESARSASNLNSRDASSERERVHDHSRVQ